MAVNSVKHDEATIKTSKAATMARLFCYLLAYRLQIVGVLLIMLICVVITLLNPLIIERAVDVHIKNKNIRSLLLLGAGAGVLNIILVILIKIRMAVMAKMSNQVLLTIRQELYTHIQTLSFDFFDSRPTGKILARVIGDVNSLKEVLSNSVTTLIPEFITICSVIVIMVAKNWKLALAALSSIPLMIVGVWFVQTKAHARWQIFRKKSSNLNAFVHEDLSGMRVIQSFSAEKETEETFSRLLNEWRSSFVDAIVYADAFGPIVDICWGIGTTCLYFVGVYMIMEGKVGVGTLMAFGTYISMFWKPVLNLSNFYNQLVTNMAGAERIFEIIDTKANITDCKEAAEMSKIRGRVKFEHVTFSYDGKTNILEDVSFQAAQGETIALVGPTGAGKTTIVNLLSRFYDIQKGAITIDGQDIRSVSLESLRSQMGIMTQDNFLFSGTIRENIRYGRLDATDEEVEEAAKAVNAHEFIMKMDMGYDTEIKERGAGLSVGQKQLLAFARTMVSKPAILILDEATSNIDTHTELLVQEGIKTLLQGRTSFVIAHRLSTIKNADRIFVIDQGGILEEGNAEELMRKKGAYYQLYMAQFEEIAG